MWVLSTGTRNFLSFRQCGVETHKGVWTGSTRDKLGNEIQGEGWRIIAKGKGIGKATASLGTLSVTVPTAEAGTARLLVGRTILVYLTI